MERASITEPLIEHLASGGHQDRACTVVRMYRDECRVSGEGDAWFVEAAFAFETLRIWAQADSRDAALVLAGEYLRESRDRQMCSRPANSGLSASRDSLAAESLE
jgi:hypothetical protein